MTDDKLINLWSDDDLDRALGALHSSSTESLAADEATLAESRARLLAAAIAEAPQPASPPRPTARTPEDQLAGAGTPAGRRGGAGTPDGWRGGVRGRWGRLLVAAGVVAGLVTGGFLVTASGPGGSAEAKADLDAAARHITTADPVIPPGKYRYRLVRTWGEARVDNGGRQLVVMIEALGETWMPADRTQEWIYRSAETEKHVWVDGSDEEARQQGITFPLSQPRTERAPCGDYFVEPSEVCRQTGSWGIPTPEWIAGLPKDPKELYKRLKKDAPRNGRGDTELLVYARDALQTGLLPADVRATLYRALGYLDDLEITDRAANLDGRTGIAYGSDDGEFREEIIIDPTNGDFIGARTVDTDDERRGDITRHTSVTTRIVDTAPR